MKISESLKRFIGRSVVVEPPGKNPFYQVTYSITHDNTEKINARILKVLEDGLELQTTFNNSANTVLYLHFSQLVFKDTAYQG